MANTTTKAFLWALEKNVHLALQTHKPHSTSTHNNNHNTLLIQHLQNLCRQTLAPTIQKAAHELVQKHKPDLPHACERAPVHLRLAALAIAAQRTLLHEARTNDELDCLTPDEARVPVGSALGIMGWSEAGEPEATPVNAIANVLVYRVGGALLPRWRRALLESAIGHWRADLGEAFGVEVLEGAPAPSRRITRCLYAEVCAAEDASELAPIFTALHGATFRGVPGFVFERECEVTGRACLRFGSF